MARPRKKNLELPKSYQYRHGAYHFVNKGKWKKVAETLAGCLEHASKRAEAEVTGTMPALIDKVLPMIKAGLLRVRKRGIPLSKGTGEQYNTAAKLLKVRFANFDPGQITAQHVWAMMDDWVEVPGTANTCLSVLSQVLKYAVRHGLAQTNVVIGVDRAYQKSRDKLPTWEEFDKVYWHGDELLQICMDLEYCTGLRIGDILKLPINAEREGALGTRQQKTGAKHSASLTEDLQWVLERIKRRPRHIKATTLLHNARGLPYSYNSINDRWLKASRKAGILDMHLHDILALGTTQVEEESGIDAAQAYRGHADQKTTKIYLRGRKDRVIVGPTRKKG